MKKIFSYSIALCFILLLTNCSKENVQVPENRTDNSTFKKSKNVIDLIDVNPESKVSRDYDPIIFFLGKAVASTLSSRKTQSLLLEFYQKSNSGSIMELCNDFPEYKQLLNAEVQKALKLEIYSDWKKETFRPKQLESSKFDFVTLFNQTIESKKRNEVLSLYVPEEINSKSGSSNLYLGIDIPTIEEAKALVFNKGTHLLLSEELAQKVNGQILFLGISEEIARSSNLKTNNKTHTLPKWWHHGRLLYQHCTDNNCTVDYEWSTQYKWYSGWRFKESGTLSSQNDSDYFNYDHRRIKVKLTWIDLSNFSLWQRHWSNDAWEEVSVD